MPHEQHPLGSGFTVASTAAEVVSGLDLSGKNAVVTGGHAGLALETTRALSEAGAFVTVGARDPGRAAPALAGIERVEVGHLDLLAEIGGVFLINNDIAPMDDPEAITHRGMGPTTGVMPYAVDPVSAQRLWQLSERLLQA